MLCDSTLQPVASVILRIKMITGLILPSLIVAVVLVNLKPAAVVWLQLPAVSILPAVWITQAVLPGECEAYIMHQ